MFSQQRKRRTFSTVLVASIALAASAALASAMSYDESEEGDDTDLKSSACSLIGCPNGNRVCGTVGGTLKAGVPPFVGEVNVNYTCYESQAR